MSLWKKFIAWYNLLLAVWAEDAEAYQQLKQSNCAKTGKSCAGCGREAPLEDSECPDCRH